MTTQAEQEMFKKMKIKPSVICRMYKCINFDGYTNWNNDGQLTCRNKNDDMTCKEDGYLICFPEITSEIREKIEEIILNNYRELCFDYWDKEKCPCIENSYYTCSCKKYFDIYTECKKYEGKAKTKQEALFSLLIRLDNKKVWEEIKGIFKCP